jgi:hypothetical protein
MGTRVVFLHGFAEGEIQAVMRAVRQAARDPQDIAFAMTTDSNKEWKVKVLVEHVAEEHERMKRLRNPGGSPSIV